MTGLWDRRVSGGGAVDYVESNVGIVLLLGLGWRVSGDRKGGGGNVGRDVCRFVGQDEEKERRYGGV